MTSQGEGGWITRQKISVSLYLNDFSEMQIITRLVGPVHLHAFFLRRVATKLFDSRSGLRTKFVDQALFFGGRLPQQLKDLIPANGKKLFETILSYNKRAFEGSWIVAMVHVSNKIKRKTCNGMNVLSSSFCRTFNSILIL